jgi:hypothetical protein
LKTKNSRLNSNITFISSSNRIKLLYLDVFSGETLLTSLNAQEKRTTKNALRPTLYLAVAGRT